MRAFSLEQAAHALGAESVAADIHFDAVSTDTRSLPHGALFVALSGERFDGHEFIAEAIRRQACAAVVSRVVEAPIEQIRVTDTQLALGRLGRMNRSAFAGTVVGVTGSAGKTGTKEMIAAVLGGDSEVLATQGNLNNEIGVPLTLLDIGPSHRYAVIEMGAGYPGDIAYLAGLATPEVGVVTNALPAHVAGMGSLESIAETKGALYAALPDDGIAVLNLDDPQATYWRRQIGARSTISWSLQDSSAMVFAEQFELIPGQGSRFTLHIAGARQSVQLRLLGRHQVANALAAAAVAHALGHGIESIRDGLESVQALKGRLFPLAGRRGSALIDDCYNANPGSVAAAIEVLAATPGKRLLLLGDMAELGAEAAAMHRDVGTLARTRGIDGLMAVGPLSASTVRAFGPGALHFDDWQTLAKSALERLDAESVVLVKGSRAAAMERVLAMLAADSSGGTD